MCYFPDSSTKRAGLVFIYMKLTYGSSARIYYSSPTLGLSLSLVTDKTTEEHALSPAKTEGGWDVPSEGESLKKKKKIADFLEHQHLKIRQVLSTCADMHLTAIALWKITGVPV